MANVLILLHCASGSVFINKLIHKLKHVGIFYHYISWLSSFLSNRQMSVKIKDTLSNSFLQTVGVAQGTSIRPLYMLPYLY